MRSLLEARAEAPGRASGRSSLQLLVDARAVGVAWIGESKRVAFALGLMCALTAHAAAVQGVATAPAREMGSVRTLPPPAADVRLADVLVHQDKEGGSVQELLALAG